MAGITLLLWVVFSLHFWRKQRQPIFRGPGNGLVWSYLTSVISLGGENLLLVYA